MYSAYLVLSQLGFNATINKCILLHLLRFLVYFGATFCYSVYIYMGNYCLWNLEYVVIV